MVSIHVLAQFEDGQVAAIKPINAHLPPPFHLPHLSWRRAVVVSGVRRMNEVNARRARLVPGWVTVFGRVYHLGM